ncbi:hypothetical protein F5J12DRAFT_724577, partial [Pisolithus orientalis]|uniref:uncharacterized protein n=1 Tax=Pisolithus orientalis TaxID=936130 RepID=UPI002224A6C0
ASKANLTAALLPFETGGSWKKSPKYRTCIPPKGTEDFRIILPNFASLSNRSPSSMETRKLL